jgi:anti-sigma-K factor RskA
MADADNLRIMLDVQQGRAAELEQVLSMAGKPGVRLTRIAGPAAAPSPSGAVFWDAQQGVCLVIGLFPPEPEGKIYQLWFLKASEKIPGGALKIDPTGRVFSSSPIPRGIAGITTLAVTVEPASGSSTPTLPYYATARIE